MSGESERLFCTDEYPLHDHPLKPGSKEDKSHNTKRPHGDSARQQGLLEEGFQPSFSHESESQLLLLSRIWSFQKRGNLQTETRIRTFSTAKLPNPQSRTIVQVSLLMGAGSGWAMDIVAVLPVTCTASTIHQGYPI